MHLCFKNIDFVNALEYISLPKKNLYVVPECLTDLEACFAEPLAAVLRIADQKVIDSMLVEGGKVKICVLGDGKLGLLSVEVRL